MRRARVVDGRDYYFRTRDEFIAAVEAGEMLEHAEVFGNFYGSPKAPVEKALEQGHDTLFDIDWQGGQQIRNSSLGRDVVSIFVLPPSIAEARPSPAVAGAGQRGGDRHPHGALERRDQPLGGI